MSEQVSDLIDALVAQLQSDGDAAPMVRAAMAHLNLAMIHPFRDGNGRMARCLQTLVLARGQILSPEWMSIEEYLGVNTQAYDDILAKVGQGAWHPLNDARPWVRFCLRAHYIQAVSVLRRARESERIWVEVDELRTARGLPERAMASLFDAATGLRIRNSSHRVAVELADGEEISNQVATNDLRGMVQAGLVKQRGAKRGSHYVATDQLQEIAAKVKADREPIDASTLFEV